MKTTERFSDRVDHYVKARPNYPPAVLDYLAAHCGLSPRSVVADVGAGTGISAGFFAGYGCTVLAVEPNGPMREAGMAGVPAAQWRDGTAEATGLPDAGVDFVVAAQAFHWFDRAKARAEFQRILRPGGQVVLMWNDRRIGSTPFLKGYEALLERLATDYKEVNHRNVKRDDLAAFFGAGGFQQVDFEYLQHLDYAGLEARMLSSSYTPPPGHPNHAPILAGLRELFEAHQEGGRIAFEYDTRLYHGPLLSACE